MEAHTLWQSFCFVGLALLVWLSLRPITIAKALWGYGVTNALWFSFRPLAPLLISPHGIDKLQNQAGQALAMLLIIPFFFHKKITHWKIESIFLALGLLDALALWCFPAGFLWARTFDASFIALLVPLAPTWLMVFFIGTVIKAKSFTGLTILCAQTLTYKRHPLKYYLLLAAGLAFAVGYNYHSGHTLYFGFERMGKWKEYFTWWDQLDDFHQFFGAGAGSYFILSPLAGNYQAPIYLQAHNDFLQTMFEFGFVGVGLLFLLVAQLIQVKGRQLALLAGVLACMLTYYPLHHFVTGCLAAYICKLCMEGDSYVVAARRSGSLFFWEKPRSNQGRNA